MGKTIKEYWALLDRALLLKTSRKSFKYTHLVQIYASTSISGYDDIVKFCEDPEQAKAQCRLRIIMVDFNAKLGEGREENVVEPHRLCIRNMQGEKLFD